MSEPINDLIARLTKLSGDKVQHPNDLWEMARAVPVLLAEIKKLEAANRVMKEALKQIVNFHRIQREKYIDSQEPHNMMEIAEAALTQSSKLRGEEK